MGLTLDIQVNGRRSAELSSRWLSLAVTDGIDYSSDSAALTLSVPGGLAVEIPPLGAELRFAADGSSLGGPLYATAIRGDTRAGAVTIEAAALDPRSAYRDDRTASYSGQTIAQIATAIAERAGLVPAISDKLGSAVPAGATQSAEPDEQFLGRLVSRLDGRVVVKHGRLTVLAAGDLDSASGRPLPPFKVDLRDSGAWARWRRSEAAIVDVVKATYFEADGATLARLTLPDESTLKIDRPKRRELPSPFASRADAEAAIRRRLKSGRSGHDYIEIETGLSPKARALYPIELAGVPPGFPERLIIHEVRHQLGTRVATTTIRARP